MPLQITFQDKATQTDLEKENTIEKILNTKTLLCTKIDSMDKELQQMKSQQHDNKYAELSQSEDLKIPELEEIMVNYCRTIGHKYPDHQCSKSHDKDNVIPAVNLE
ncbi:hypothetical protein H5410_002784 [Solanum commersonii]|uniref:Uncharacterized protein n=1 Tax=Solanum commersonii TaxID=4109 RepID=A0A9J6B379_SOLCO|nr:hypothetical protein H5410_002784 [Solanum commersonii]